MNILNKRFRGRGGAEEKNMKGKGIRSAIAASALSAVLCAGMLAGTTFAWFTDTVSSTGNSIMAGNLDITATKAELDPSADAQYTFTNRDDETETYALAFGAAEEFDGEAIIAETAFAPGMWNAKLLTVTNAGDLAVYVKLNFVTQDEGLADALWFDFIGVNGESVTGELTHREMSTLEGFGSDMEIPLAADESVSYILIYGMDKEAGNTYQGMNFNVDAYILARQQTEGATYPAIDIESLTQAVDNAENGDTIVVGNDITTEETLVNLAADKEITLDLNGKTLTFNGTYVNNIQGNGYAMEVRDGASLTLENGTIEMTGNPYFGIHLCDNTSLTLRNMKVNSVDTGIMGDGHHTNILIEDSEITTGTYFAVYQNGSHRPAKIVIRDSIITATDAPAIYVSNSAGQARQTLVIENCTITGTTAVEVKHTDVTITDSTLTGTATPTGSVENNNGSCSDGYSFAMTTNGANDRATGNVALTNCLLYNGTETTGESNGYYFIFTPAEGFTVTINGTQITDFEDSYGQ